MERLLPPIGYRIVAAEQRGAKVKKKIEIDPLRAETVRLIYRLALQGDSTNGPIGVKTITNHLNSRRSFTRDGGRWSIGQVHRILTRATYVGRHEFNKCAKGKKLNPTPKSSSSKSRRLSTRPRSMPSKRIYMPATQR